MLSIWQPPTRALGFLQKGRVFSWPSPFDHHCLVQGWTLIQAGPAQVACLLSHSRLAHVWEFDWVWATKVFFPSVFNRDQKKQYVSL